MNTATTRYLDGKHRHELKVGRHTLYADVSVAEGGDDSAPSPHDYLSLALATCTSMTVRMYAIRKGWALTNAVVTVDIEKSATGTLFKRSIDLQGSLSEEEKTRLLDIANKCPIHKVLTGKIDVETKLV